MSNLFRKEAMENHSPNREITLAVKAIPVKWVVYMTVLFICAASFAVWLFFGTVYETVSLRGIAWPDDSCGDVYAETSGIIAKTTVSVGDKVEVGDILAVMPNNDVLEKSAGGSIEQVYDEYDRKSVIRSKANGIVTYIADRNSYVNHGDKIASVIHYDKNDNNDIVTVFVSDEKSSLIEIGMEAQIMPDYAPREQYGYIIGYVSAISEYPVTGEQIYNSDKQLYMSGMDMDESYIEVQVTMMRASGEESSLKWSKASGENKTVNPGTRCDVDVILRKYKPYRWLLRWEK